MKIIITFLAACGLAAAQSAEAPNPVQQSADNRPHGRGSDACVPGYRSGPHDEGD